MSGSFYLSHQALKLRNLAQHDNRARTPRFFVNLGIQKKKCLYLYEIIYMNLLFIKRLKVSPQIIIIRDFF